MSKVCGFTQVKAKFGDQSDIFRANPWYPGKPWYDWSLVSYQKQGQGEAVETRTYPARVYGFMRFQTDTNVKAVHSVHIDPPTRLGENQD